MRVLICSLALIVTAETALADTVTWDFEAQITSAPSATILFEGVGLPTAVAGSFQFDSESTGIPELFGIIFYQNFLDAFQITIDGETYESAGDFGSLTFGDNHVNAGAALPTDLYLLRTGAIASASGEMISVELRLVDSVDTRFNPGELPDGFESSELPLTPPDLSLFDATLFRVFVGSQIALQGTISSLVLHSDGEQQPIPEPGTLSLLGVLALGFLLARLPRRFARARPA